MRHLLTMLFAMVTILQSCTQNDALEEPSAHSKEVNIKLSTRSLQLSSASVQSVRIIVCDKEGYNIRLNELNPTDVSTTADEGSFKISLPAGSYTFYTIVNEPENLTTTLNELRSKAELTSLKIQPATPFAETTVMLSQQKDAVVAIDDQGDATIDGSSTPLSMELDRVSTKVSLTIKKQTVDPADKFTIKKVAFMHSPTYSYFNAQVYDGTTFVSREVFNGSIEFSTNEESKEIVKEFPADAEPSNIFGEYLLAAGEESLHAKAAYFYITATYTPSGSFARDVHYTVPVGNYQGNTTVDGAGHDYNLKRNYHYTMSVNISKQGEKDAVEIRSTVEPWKSQWIDVKVEGDPFLDVSNVAAEVYDAAATRIYFYSNMPEVKLDPNLLNGTQSVPVNDLFASLAGAETKNFTYTYDPATKRGEGYLDLINVHTDNIANIKRLLYLRSGELVREIAATTRISPEVAKNNPQRYIGTFHRANERGERIVSWYLPPTTQWRVEIVKSPDDDEGVASDPYYADAAYLRIDHLASPNHAQLYTLAPPDAEGAFVTDDATVTKLEGQDRIYFRVGWTSILTDRTSHRFAKIKVTTSTDGFATSSVHYLYCRQGEQPKAIVSRSTVFSCYNILTPERFVDYPTKTGFLYQWNRKQSWEVTGIANNYPTGDRAPASGNSYVYEDYDPQKELCPSGYAYPDGNALDVVKNALNPVNVMYQWGYYADGFFDRRAVNEHIVRSASGEIASAGGMFLSRNTAVTIFLPTASWRDDNGEINAKTDHHQLGVIGHYWTQPQDGEWSNTRALASPHTAWTLHLSTAGSPDSYLELLNKASAASVRCMKLEGLTVYFDANGGLSTPRSITQESGNITFPAGPVHKDNSLTFLNWATTRSGTGTAYNAGDAVDIRLVGEKTFYANYQRYYTVNGVYFFVSKAEAKSLIWSAADQYCKNLTPANSWRLPTRAELGGIYLQNPVLFTGGYWTADVSTASDGPNYVVGHFYMSGNWFGGTPDDNPQNVRCVREFTK